MWQFLDNHPIIGVVFLSLFLILLAVGIGLIVKAIKKGGGIRAKLGNNELEISGKKEEITRKNKYTSEIVRDAMSDAIMVSNAANKWKKNLDDKIRNLQNMVISSCIKTATQTIGMYCDDALLEYGKVLREEKKDGEKLTTEENYQIIMYGFITDTVRDLLKDIVCETIREDHFDSKTQSELLDVGNDAFRKVKFKFESNMEQCGLRKDILKRIAKKYESIIKESTTNIINMTAEKYRKLQEDSETLITTETQKEKEKLKFDYPGFPPEHINTLVNYYE